MSDSSRCQYEQSRCHSSNNALYTDLFSPDKWTRTVWKSLSWIKQLSPKPLLYLSYFLKFAHWGLKPLHLGLGCPRPCGRTHTWMVQNCLLDCFSENPSRGHQRKFISFACLSQRKTQPNCRNILADKREWMCVCSLLLYCRTHITDIQTDQVFKKSFTNAIYSPNRATTCNLWKTFGPCLVNHPITNMSAAVSTLQGDLKGFFLTASYISIFYSS